MYFINKKTGQKFEYEIRKKPRIKNLNITICKKQKVIIGLPQSRLFSITKKQIEKILEDKTGFIIKGLARYKKLSQQYPDLFDFSREHYWQHKKMAREIIESKVNYYCRQYNFQYNRISIRNQLTRWGSCSSKGNLNFNYKLFFLLPEEQDYIVVHELCHLKEQNHSQNFWREVASIIPNYKEIHKNIKNKT